MCPDPVDIVSTVRHNHVTEVGGATIRIMGCPACIEEDFIKYMGTGTATATVAVPCKGVRGDGRPCKNPDPRFRPDYQLVMCQFHYNARWRTERRIREWAARAAAHQPAPTPNEGRPVWDLVIEDMQERDRVGRERYGTPLQTNNGRDALVDAYQEALDLVVYLRQAIAERDARNADQ